MIIQKILFQLNWFCLIFILQILFHLLSFSIFFSSVFSVLNPDNNWMEKWIANLKTIVVSF